MNIVFKISFLSPGCIISYEACTGATEGTKIPPYWGGQEGLMATVYKVNKGINKSIEFKGIKAQYIIYLAIGFIALLLLFAILFIAGINTYVCLIIILPAGGALYITVQQLSKKYGEHGLMKKAAQKQLPVAIQSRTSKIFIQLKESDNG